MNKLRPDKLIDIIGQEDVKKVLQIAIESARIRNCVIPSFLLEGPKGTGKSTICMAVGNELGVHTYVVNGGEVTSPKNLLPTLMKLKSKDIMFIDEIHRINVKVSEFLYPCIEDFKLDSMGESIILPRFTFAGATTESGSIAPPLYDRFTYKLELQLYSVEELSTIITLSAQKLGLDIDDSAAHNLARRARGTPRIGNNLILFLRDFVVSKGSRTVRNEHVDSALDLVKIDADGTTEQDRAYLRALKKAGKPMGLSTLADTLSIDSATVSGIIEPHLLRLNKIRRTPKGRVLI